MSLRKHLDSIFENEVRRLLSLTTDIIQYPFILLHQRIQDANVLDALTVY